MRTRLKVAVTLQVYIWPCLISECTWLIIIPVAKKSHVTMVVIGVMIGCNELQTCCHGYHHVHHYVVCRER